MIQVKTEHGVVVSMPEERFGYFGWPSIARMDDGTLVVAASGYRTEHICPWGKTVLMKSTDDGRTWSDPHIVNDCPIDDRDAGVVSLGGKRLLLTWFTSDTRTYVEGRRERLGDDVYRQWHNVIDLWTDDLVDEWLGSWVRVTDDGETWKAPVRVPVTAPHGPVVVRSGDLLYLGKGVDHRSVENRQLPLRACRSADGGATWEILGDVPPAEGMDEGNVHEPHALELPSGRLLGMIRYQHSAESRTYESFSLFQTESDDRGATWSVPRELGVCGSPPHLLRHSSGAIVCVYGYRREPYGERAIVSADDGATWSDPVILFDDAPSGDLGYPASVELGDGSIFTVYYQKTAADAKCGIHWTRWRLLEE